MKLNWKFLGEGRAQTRKLSMEEVWIFSGTTQFMFEIGSAFGGQATAPPLKELHHQLSILKLFKIVISNRFDLFHPQPSLFLFVLESPLWCFPSSVDHYF